MKYLFLSGALCLLAAGASAQEMSATPAAGPYRATSEKINDLVHTKVDARFDFEKSQMKGKAWITLRPHFYATDSLRLDAKGMDIKSVSLVRGSTNVPLKYQYDGSNLQVRLDRAYRNTETYTIYVDYVARPDELEAKGSAAISDAKGLYFINPRGEEKGKPTQIWTQGETEATSVWVPIIDRPNQKTTQETIMTVPAKWVTLSNGLLVKQTKNADGTRTDHWKMDLPHAPYLFFMGAGDFAVVKDQWKGKEVSYYVEKEYAPVARRIFGYTPEMMTYFSRITGVDFPWPKYAQIVGRDYVSGAMENTTATLHQESAQQDARELTDGNGWEGTIAHELFHQWFGDYVTAESWSNLTLNESFANYSETLWSEYKHGKDAADAHNWSDMQGYLGSNSEKKDLVRFHYNDKEDMFDAVSYNKGGRILHMLRNFVGDSAFFKALNGYLSTNKFRSAEAQQLRLAFEEVTGKDLNWFWNQWYYGSGHPKLDVNYSYDEASKQVKVVVTQKQDKMFQLPVAIDVYNGANRSRYNVWVTGKSDSFTFAAPTRPDLVNFDGDKVLLATRTENKTLAEYAHQYQYAGKYVDRREAIDAAARRQDEAAARALMIKALDDKYEGLRAYAVSRVDLRKAVMKEEAEATLARLAANDKSRGVKAAAIQKLGEYRNKQYVPIFRANVGDSSYTVSGNALEALSKVDSASALEEAKKIARTKTKGKLNAISTRILIQSGDVGAAANIIENFENMGLSQQKFELLSQVGDALARVSDATLFQRGTDAIMKFAGQVPEAYRSQVGPYIEGILKGIQQKQEAAGRKANADYVQQQLAKKQF
ncbi:M1 family peptidase [Flaviaesturariibacter flavus]|uniref:Aminopeptidase N n=1 Tax=Flaviaesturariibacter flavus TaxID=2502780 RepID=A0A4R1BM71_9BACT|nr:M1 family aminopeptidase [Flaviaesturariibacter flavus]TCJ18590.1 M1 family peptidase [Flaviaesturariibacter flavus]